MVVQSHQNLSSTRSILTARLQPTARTGCDTNARVHPMIKNICSQWLVFGVFISRLGLFRALRACERSLPEPSFQHASPACRRCQKSIRPFSLSLQIIQSASCAGASLQSRFARTFLWRLSLPLPCRAEPWRRRATSDLCHTLQVSSR